MLAINLKCISQAISAMAIREPVQIFRAVQLWFLKWNYWKLKKQEPQNQQELQKPAINNKTMTDQELEQLRYPVGRYQPQQFSEQLLNDWLIDIRFLPNHLEHAILNLDEAQLNTPYRPGGWNLRQVVHHVADSHMNALTRFKLCLTEDKPTIKPYDENKWVLLPDAELLPVNISITQ